MPTVSRDFYTAAQQALADLGFAVASTETPQNILALACAQCHHLGLDQGLNRAKYSAVGFTKMANLNAEVDIAISRLKLGYTPERLEADGIKILAAVGSQIAMYKCLTEPQIDSLIKYLESQKKP